jgi:hypothetical protein
MHGKQRETAKRIASQPTSPNRSLDQTNPKSNNPLSIRKLHGDRGGAPPPSAQPSGVVRDSKLVVQSRLPAAEGDCEGTALASTPRACATNHFDQTNPKSNNPRPLTDLRPLRPRGNRGRMPPSEQNFSRGSRPSVTSHPESSQTLHRPELCDRTLRLLNSRRNQECSIAKIHAMPNHYASASEKSRLAAAGPQNIL